VKKDLATAPESAEQLVKRARHRDQFFLLRLSDRLSRMEDASAIAVAAAQALGRHLKAQACYSERSGTGAWVAAGGAWSERGIETDVACIYPAFFSGIETALARGETQRIDDAGLDTHLRSTVADRHMASVIVPVVKEGRLVAALSVRRREPRAWSDGEVRLIRKVAERGWLALERARAVVELRETQARQAFLLALGDRLREEADPQAIMAITNRALGEHLGALRVGYGEIDPTGEHLTLKADWTNGVESNAGTFPLAAYGEQGAQESRAGRIFVSNDLAADPRVGPDHMPAFSRWGVAALVAVPLIKRQRFTAVLSVQSGVPRIWTDAEVQLMAEVSERTWAAVERARAEAEMRHSQALLAAFMENAPASMYLKDAEGRYLLANADVSRRLGIPPEQIVGRTLSQIASPEIARHSEMRERTVLANGSVETGEQVFQLPGGIVHALATRFPVPDADGRLTQVGGVLIDITAQKRAEAELERSREALHQSEKLTALGSLLAGVSHELNNPLAVVVAHSMLLEEEAARFGSAERVIKIRRAAERCAKIVHTFLAMARQKPPERTRIDPNAVVRGALDLTEYALRTAGVEVECSLAPDLPMLNADPDQLNQLLTNLLINAQQALQEVDAPRRLSIATRMGSAPGTIAIEVADNGSGMPPEVRRRVFEPFFTTKPQGVGTGLGLSFSLGVAEAHGGRLELLDRSVGAAFLLTLPACEAGGARPVPETTRAIPASEGQALVIDDEPEIAELLAEVLKQAGFGIRIASNGAEAKALLRTHDFDVVLSDLRMPEVDGPALHAWIATKRPALLGRIGFITGDTLGTSAQRFLRDSGCPYLEKPFTPDALRAFLQRLRAATIDA
jgi:PAS domain S-box-containing protein